MPIQDPLTPFTRMRAQGSKDQQIIGLRYRIANTLGHGFAEKVYENALAFEFRRAKIVFAQQQSIEVFYADGWRSSRNSCERNPMSNLANPDRGPGRALAALLALAALGLGGFVIWRTDAQPRTDDAYAYADTISVTPEVSGRIVDLVARDNQAVHKGDVLFRIDPRPFQDTLAKAQASLNALDREIELTQRFPVRILIENPDPAWFRIGASAVATLDGRTSAR